MKSRVAVYRMVRGRNTIGSSLKLKSNTRVTGNAAACRSHQLDVRTRSTPRRQWRAPSERFRWRTCLGVSSPETPAGLVKMVMDPHDLSVVGTHIVSTVASEMIHEAVLAVKFRLTVDDLISTTHVLPTMSEGIKRAAQSFRRDISTTSCIE